MYATNKKLVKLEVEKKGCMGLSYKIALTDIAAKEPLDEIVTQDGIQILIDGKSFMYILGTQVDFQEDELNSKFVFANPNAVKKCHCGDSFNIK
jgi:iron-sulfur cluster assembly accessory protein